MRLAVLSHCSIDTITVGGSTYEQAGGPACYCAITARRLGVGAELHSRFGPDFPAQYLREEGIECRGCESGSPTTRFAISVSGPDRTLRIEHECEPVAYGGSDADAHLVSPIYRELDPGVLAAVRRDSEFVMVDPQGFLREAGPDGTISLRGADLDLSGVGAIKVSPDEAACLAGGSGDAGAAALQRRGAGHVLLTDGTDVTMYEGGRAYSVSLPNRRIRDTTGVGDIFCSAFCSTMLRERDPLWALCFAGGAAQAALDSGDVGLQKVPRRGAVQTNASYFYNLVGFRDV